LQGAAGARPPTAPAKTAVARREPYSVLTLNGGSSSIRFAVFAAGAPLRRQLDGKIDRVGLRGTKLTFSNSGGQSQDGPTFDSANPISAIVFLLDWLEAQPVFASVKAAGHRVVHGMSHTEPERVTPELLRELRRITPYDPEHLPLAIALMESSSSGSSAAGPEPQAWHRLLPKGRP
jgi:acetate kinase